MIVSLFIVQTRQLMSKHKCHDQDRAISSLAVHESSLFTASFDNTVICWDIAVGGVCVVESLLACTVLV